MTDIFTTKKRSKIMSEIRSKETKLEVQFRKKLWAEGFRCRKNTPGYFGRPDILLKKYKTVIFIDSCFWHGCPKHFRMPLSNKKYWKEKIERNVSRDREVNKHYKKIGWKIIRVWEHELKIGMELLIEKSIKKIRTIKNI